MKPANIHWFYKKLRGRGMSLTKIAAEMKTTHAHLSQVINGTRGAHTRKHFVRYLRASETELLGWEEKGELPEEIVPQGTVLQKEQNTANEPRRRGGAEAT